MGCVVLWRESRTEKRPNRVHAHAHEEYNSDGVVQRRKIGREQMAVGCVRK